jgi:two-component system, LuxR family, sensor kinase FixL
MGQPARSSEQRYQTLFQFVPVALIRFDRTELAGVFENLKSQGVSDLLRYIEGHPDFVDYSPN